MNYEPCGVEYALSIGPMKKAACDQPAGHAGPHVNPRAHMPPAVVEKFDAAALRHFEDKRNGTLGPLTSREDLKRKPVGEGEVAQ